MDLVKALAIGLKAKLYFKEFNKITGSVHCSLFLGQLIYWADKNDYKPFYKFRQPCQHELYREGDSWVEELDFEIRMIDKCVKTLKELGILETKTTIQRVTFYELKIEKLNDILSKNAIYENSQNAIYENSENAIYKENCKNAIYENSENAILLHNTKNTNSKTTTNTTNKEFLAESEKSQNVKTENEKAVINYLYGNRWLLPSDKPPFISDEVWADYCAFKREREQKVVRTELKAFLAQLEKAHNLGVDVNARILECISKGYKSPVLEPRANETNAKSKAEGVKKSRQVLKEWVAKKMAVENEIIDGEVIDDNTRIQCGF